MKYIVYISLLLFFISFNAFSKISRIENFEVDRKKVSKIYISFSKAQVIRFPEAIEEVRLGLPNFFETEISKTYKKELTVFLKKDINFPSNLIVRTSSSKVFVFDLVPSKYNHQDVLFIDESYYNYSIVSDKARYSKKSYLKQTSNKRNLLVEGSKIFLFSNEEAQ